MENIGLKYSTSRDFCEWNVHSMKDISILKIVDSETFWIKEIADISKSNDLSMFEIMNSKMNEYCENFDNLERFIPKKDEICCVLWKRTWNRGRVLMKIQSPAKGIFINVWLVDHCTTVNNVLQNEVKECRKEWLDCPFQGIKIKLYGIAPFGMKFHLDEKFEVTEGLRKNWDEGTDSFVKKLISEASSIKFMVIQKNVDCISGLLFLYRNGEFICLNQELINNRMAVSIENEPLQDLPFKFTSEPNFTSRTSTSNSDKEYHFSSSSKSITKSQFSQPEAEVMKTSKDSLSSEKLYLKTHQELTSHVSGNLSKLKSIGITNSSKPMCVGSTIQSKIENERIAALKRSLNATKKCDAPKLNDGNLGLGRGLKLLKNLNKNTHSAMSKNHNPSISEISNYVHDNNECFESDNICKSEELSNETIEVTSSIHNETFRDKPFERTIESDFKIFATDTKAEKNSIHDACKNDKFESSSSSEIYLKPTKKAENMITAKGRGAILLEALNKTHHMIKPSQKYDESKSDITGFPNHLQPSKVAPERHFGFLLKQLKARQGLESQKGKENKELGLQTVGIRNNEEAQMQNEAISPPLKMNNICSNDKRNKNEFGNQFEDTDEDENVVTQSIDLPSSNITSFMSCMASTFKTLNEHIVGQVYSCGEQIPPPYLRIDNVFVNFIMKRLYELSFNSPSTIQRHAWPSINRGRNVVVVAAPSPGNILIYLIPILSSLMEYSKYEFIPSGNGPLALILCKSSEAAHYLYSISMELIKESKIKCSLLHAGQEDQVKIELLNGCDLLIATPNSLLRTLNCSDNVATNLDRVCHMVLSEADDLTEGFTNEIQEIMSRFVKALVSSDRKSTFKQIITYSTRWNKALESYVNAFFYLNHEQAFTAPIVHVSSFLEVAILLKIATIAFLMEEKSTDSKLSQILCDNVAKKTIIFTSYLQNAKRLHNIVESCSRFVLLIHDHMNQGEIQGVRELWSSSVDSKSAPVLICVDSNIYDLKISDAECIIHFDLPRQSLTTFGLRFSSLLDNLPKDLKNKELKNKCICYLILIKKYIKQSPSILKFLKRIEAKVPEALLELVDKRNKELERKKSNLDLCYYVKAFGECTYELKHKSRCKHRHILNTVVDKPNPYIPKSGLLMLNIIDVVNAGQYYAHIVDHYEDFSDVKTKHSTSESSRSEKCFKFFMELSIYYADMKNHEKVAIEDIFVDELYATYLNDYYCRIKILKIEMKTEALVFFVDEGLKKSIHIGSILKLPMKFKDVPYQAVEIFICNIKPKDNELDWNPAAIFKVRNEVLSKKIIGKIKLCIGNTIWLDPFIRQDEIDGLNLRVNGFRVDEFLLENKSAERNPDHLQNLIKVCEKCGISVPKVDDQLEKSNSCKIKKQSIKSARYAFLDVDQFEHVQVSVVNSPKSFYVQKVNSYKCLTDLSKDLTAFVNNNKRHFLLDCHEGAICLGYFEAENMWCRSKVIEVLTDAVVLLFLDYGDRYEIPKKELLQIPKQFLLLPFQAIHCSLAAAQLPEGVNEWPESTAIALENLTRDNDGHLAYLPLKVHKKFSDEPGISYEVFLLKPEMLSTNAVSIMLAKDKLLQLKHGDLICSVLKNYDSLFLSDDCDSDSSSIEDELERLKIMKEFSVAKTVLRDDAKECQEIHNGILDAHKNSETKKLTPTVKWSQNKHEILLSVKLVGVKEYNTILKEQYVYFSCQIDNDCYEFDFELFGKIDSNVTIDNNIVKVLGTEVLMRLTKADDNYNWPRLLERELKNSNIGFDFDRNDICLSDSENEHVSAFDGDSMRKELINKLGSCNKMDYSSSESLSSSSGSDRGDYDLFC